MSNDTPTETFYRIKNNGNTCTIPASCYVRSEWLDPEYEVEKIEMTVEEFESIPEFTGF